MTAQHLGSELGSAVSDVGTLRELVGRPSELVLAKELDHLDRHAREFIALSPFVVISTSAADGSQDCSPRGDPPGFVRVLGERRLLLPDRKGNRRADSMRNVLENPHVGMMFLVPGTSEILRVNGRASLTTDADLLADCAVSGQLPRIAMLVDVLEVFMHCARAVLRAKLWAPETWPEGSRLPSLGAVLADQIGRPQDAAALDEELAEANADLY